MIGNGSFFKAVMLAVLWAGCTATPPVHRDGQIPGGSSGPYVSVAVCYLPAPYDKDPTTYSQVPLNAVGAVDGRVVDTQFCSPLAATFTDGLLVACVATDNPNDTDECDIRTNNIKQYVASKKTIDNVKPNLRVHLTSLSGLINVDVSSDGKSFGFLGFIVNDNEKMYAPANTDSDCFAKLTSHSTGIYADLYLDRCLTTSRAQEVAYLKFTQNVKKPGYARIDAIEARTFKKGVK